MLQNVMFASRAEAEARAGWPDWSVISITGLNPAQLKSGWRSILRIEFDDIDVTNPDFQAEEP